MMTLSNREMYITYNTLFPVFVFEFFFFCNYCLFSHVIFSEVDIVS